MNYKHLLIGTAALAAVMASRGDVFVLTFEGLGNLEPVGSFYEGGLGGNGSGPGPNYGIEFSPNSLAIIDADAGGSGNFGGEPSPDTTMFFLNGTAIMNVAAGFDTGFSFFYAAINNPGFVNVYDGLDGTGTLLATIDLPLTPFNGAPDPTGQFSPLLPVGVAFAGIAKSIDFGGTVNQIGFDDVTFGSATPGEPTPVPEASTVMSGIALGGLVGGYAMRRRQAKTA